MIIVAGFKRRLSKHLKNASPPFLNDQLPVLSQDQGHFNMAVSSLELADIYQFALSRLPSKPLYALTLLRRIVDYPCCLPVQAYAQNQMALYLLNSYDAKQDPDKILLQLIRDGLASEVDTLSAQPAIHVAVVYAYFLSGCWTEAAQFLMNLPEPSWQSAALSKTFGDLLLGSNLDFLTGDISPEKLTAFETVLAWTKQHHHQTLASVALVTGELYIHQGTFLHAFQLYSDLLKEGQNEALVYSKLGETCWYMNRLAEAEHYYQETISRLSDMDMNPDAQKMLNAAKITLGAILCEQGKNIEHAVDLFKELLTGGMHSNPIYHNLAMCYYWQQDYQKSLDFCRKALKLSADETTMLLIAKNHQALKQFDAAVNWCEKALAFTEEIEPSFVIDKGNNQSISFSRPEWLSEKKRDIYQCLIHCYMETGDYQAAADSLQQAASLWPRDSGLAHLQTALTTLKAGQAAGAVQATKEIQDKQANLVHTIKEDLLRRYPSAHPLTLDFLATGEYLLQTYNEQTPDYSPVLLPFAKALENELTILLCRLGHITEKGKYTLGELAYLLKKHTGTTPLTTVLQSTVKLRNSAAHQRIIARPAVEEVRNSLFDGTWLEMLWKL